MKKKILIIDDDVNMRNAIKRLLAWEDKYDIREAGDGIEAEKKIEDFLPDLIILDIRMPGKNGYETCLNLKDKPHLQNIKIVGISGYAGKIGGSIMGALGTDYFFEKPFDNEKFKNKIAQLLEVS